MKVVSSNVDLSKVVSSLVVIPVGVESPNFDVIRSFVVKSIDIVDLSAVVVLLTVVSLIVIPPVLVDCFWVVDSSTVLISETVDRFIVVLCVTSATDVSCSGPVEASVDIPIGVVFSEDVGFLVVSAVETASDTVVASDEPVVIKFLSVLDVVNLSPTVVASTVKK